LKGFADILVLIRRPPCLRILGGPPIRNVIVSRPLGSILRLLLSGPYCGYVARPVGQLNHTLADAAPKTRVHRTSQELGDPEVTDLRRNVETDCTACCSPARTRISMETNHPAF
jgi:hypothetical protein